MKFICKSLLILSLLYIPADLFAWGANGHRITGQIAFNHLSNKAKRNIAEILGNESMAYATNWADFIKSDTNFNYLSSWHYINLKSGLDSASVQEFLKQEQNGTNIYSKILWLSGELKKKDISNDTKKFYLRLLIHFVGDIHQPMHTGRPDDLGGNRINITWFNEPSNLHRLWDDQLIEFQKLSYTEYATEIDHVTKWSPSRAASRLCCPWVGQWCR
ncbi:MAG: S1/P1 nuclease [Flavitalea sp.]